MKRSKILFFSIILFALAICIEQQTKIDESVFEGILNSIEVTDYENQMNQFKNTTDLTYLVYYYRKDSSNSMLGAYYLKRIDRKLDYLAVILLVNCDRLNLRGIPQCQIMRTDVDTFPRIKLLAPPLFKFDPKTKKMNSYSEIGYSEENVSEEILFKFITSNIPSYSSRLTQKTIEHFLNQPLFNKILLFTDKPSTPVVFKGLSNVFYDRILFGEVFGPENKELMDKFNITKAPSLIAIENPVFLKDNYKIHNYNGTKIPEQVYKFIEKYALRQKHYIKRLEEAKLEKNPFTIFTKDDYENFFEGEDRLNYKLVYFTNFTIDLNKFPEDLKRFAKLTSGFINFGAFNCKKNRELCRKIFYVDTDTLPALYFFDPKANGANFKLMAKKNRMMGINYDKLLNYFSRKVENNVNKTGNEDLFSMILDDRENEKYPIIYVHKNETNINLPLQFISSIPEYQEKLSFYNFDDPSDAILETFKIEYKGPFTVMLIHNKDREDSFRLIKLEENYKNNYLGLKMFIENMIGDYVFPIKPMDFFSNRKPPQNKYFINLEEASVFNRKCVYDRNLCAILLIDGDFDKELKIVNVDFKDTLKIVKKIPNQNRNIHQRIGHFFYVNATCHDEFISAFKVSVSQLPAVVLYDGLRKMYIKYDKEKKKFDRKRIEKFLEKGSNREPVFSLVDVNNGIPVFDNKDCSVITRKAKNVDYDKLDRIKKGLEDDDEEEENTMKTDL